VEPERKVSWEVNVENSPQKIFVESFDDLIQVRKQDFKLSVGMTIFELEAAIAVLNWVLKAGVIHAEAEHAKDILSDAKMGIEKCDGNY